MSFDSSDDFDTVGKNLPFELFTEVENDHNSFDIDKEFEKYCDHVKNDKNIITNDSFTNDDYLCSDNLFSFYDTSGYYKSKDLLLDNRFTQDEKIINEGLDALVDFINKSELKLKDCSFANNGKNIKSGGQTFEKLNSNSFDKKSASANKKKLVSLFDSFSFPTQHENPDTFLISTSAERDKNISYEENENTMYSSEMKNKKFLSNNNQTYNKKCLNVKKT